MSPISTKLKVTYDTVGRICEEDKNLTLQVALPLRYVYYALFVTCITLAKKLWHGCNMVANLNLYQISLEIKRYSDAKWLCTSLGGSMTLDVGQKFHQTFGDSTYCETHATDLKYWIPVKLKNYSDGVYKWSSDTYLDNNIGINELRWARSQPNAFGIDKCVGMIEISGKYFANDDDCERLACSLCKIPVISLFYLRGEGPENLLFSRYNQVNEPTLLDRVYFLFFESQTDDSKLVFEGKTGLSKISWIPSQKVASIKRYDSKPILQGGKSTLNISYLMTDPFGKHRGLRWTFTRVKSTSKYH